MFESLLSGWLGEPRAIGEEFPELNAFREALGKHSCWPVPRESCSWEELRLGAPFRRNCEKDRRAEPETSLLESLAPLWACSESDYKLARI